MVPPCSDRISRVPPYSRTIMLSTRTGLSPTTARLSRRFRFLHDVHWPGPRSLATTSGVSVDVLSSGYLDVSLRRVCSLYLCIQYRMTHKGRVSPFGYLRINGCSHLPTAFRRVPRPSSPLGAKASTKCLKRLLEIRRTQRQAPDETQPGGRTAPERPRRALVIATRRFRFKRRRFP